MAIDEKISCWFRVSLLSLLIAFPMQWGAEEVVPKLSIITSLYKGDKFIKGFLENITEQTIFSECELILINANSPGSEEEVIAPYLEKFSNIKYKKLIHDPGIYGTWNLAIRLASSDLLTNANVDDRSRKDAYEKHVAFLRDHSDIDLVYADYYVTDKEDLIFEPPYFDVYCVVPDFEPKKMNLCLPGPRPVWRKSLHTRVGFFDESFKILGDWEMWNRAVQEGAKFQRIPGFYTLFLQHSASLSSDPNPERVKIRKDETERVIKKYSVMWGWNSR